MGQPRKPFGGFGGPRKSVSENGKPVGDLRSILAKKQSATVTDLRSKLKPKALYTSKLASRSQQTTQHQQQGADNGRGPPRGPERKPLKLTTTFKNSVSSAVSGSSKPSPHERTRSAPVSHRSRPASKLPSYDEAKKISVTVPGLSRPVSEVRVKCRWGEVGLCSVVKG